MTNYTLPVQESDDGSLFIEFPPEVLTSLGWKEGDTVTWSSTDAGAFMLQKQEKQETEWVLVETALTYRIRYMVEVPKGKKEYALDTVTCEEAKEFSQECIGEQIMSHRVVTKEEALTMCDTDNDYTESWDDKRKEQTFFTKWQAPKE